MRSGYRILSERVHYRGGESTNGRRKEGTIDGLTDRLDERTNERTNEAAFAEEAKMDLTPLSLTGSSENPSDTSRVVGAANNLSLFNSCV